MRPFVFAFLAMTVLAGISIAQAASLPAPYATPSVTNSSRVVAWPSNTRPFAPEGFSVTRFAVELKSPRWLYSLPNGDVLVAEAKKGPGIISADRITLLRDSDDDGTAELKTVLVSGLKKPFGMALVDGYLYVANTNSIVRFPYRDDDTEITAKPEHVADLPEGGRHWTKSLLASKDGKTLYVGSGSASDHAEDGIEKERGRAAILAVDIATGAVSPYAEGLRNPVGIAFHPSTGALWAVVNERDELGDDLVPDYLTSVREGGFYGWPYSYFGQHEDPRRAGENPELVAKAIVPDYPLAAHSASLGLDFYDSTLFPDKYREGAFIGQHGSWNRSEFSGYKVVFVPFKKGKPAGPAQDFLTGFTKGQGSSEVYGRPVGVIEHQGKLLVADDGSHTIWAVRYDGPQPVIPQKASTLKK